MIQLLQNNLPSFLSGFGYTLLSSAIGLFFSLLIGILMALGQISPLKWLRTLTRMYVEFFRNIPLLVIVLFFYVVVPLYLFKINGFAAGTLGLILYTSSFVADVVRSGINSIPKGQMEAGLSSGLTRRQVLRLIILPQALRIVLPPLGNQAINLIKNSSILAMVAGMDLMYQGDIIASTTFNTIDTYIIIGLFYLLLTVPISIFVKRTEQRLKVTHH